MQLSIAFLLLTISAPYVIGFSNGPPIVIFPGTCQSLNPQIGHGASDVTNSPPYQITTTTATDGSFQGKH